MPSGSATAPYIGYAYANGLTKGASETTYSGTNPVTRNQYLLFLMRAMGYANHASYGNGTTTADAEFVADKAEIPQDLEWWRHFTLRRAGTYQYTYRPAERAGSVALASLSETYDADPRRN